MRRGDALLLVRRARPPAAGRWSVPGGRVQPGESLAAAVVREVAEETGIAVTTGEFLGFVERIGSDPVPYHFVILDFAARETAPARDPVPGDDAAAARFVPLAQLASLDLVDGLRDFLDGVGALQPSRNT